MSYARSGSLLVACLLASSSLLAAPERLTEDQARHLLIRSGFAPSQLEVDRITGQSAQKAVSDMILQAKAARPGHAAPAFVSEPPPPAFRDLKTQDERQAVRREQLRQGQEIKAWWMREMVETASPLEERMTLFWHNHFATSQQKVIRSQAMWAQHQLLRAHAMGNFRSLLHGIAKDPAMLVYLDGANSRKEAPNENFAREVMELFTLGEASQGGKYSEADIKEAARAFTGWSVERDGFAFVNRPRQHDGDSKTILGRTGRFDGDEALDIMLAQPAAPRFIVGKLWKEFVSPTPNAEMDRIVSQFQAQNFDIAVAVKDLLLSDAFWAPENRGSLIKSPVDLVVGTVRQFGLSYADMAPLAAKSAQLGQNLLFPPNVKGWPGHTDWINATTLLDRQRFGEQIFRAVEMQDEGRSSMGMMAPEPVPGATKMANTSSNADMMMAPGGKRRGPDALAAFSFDADRWLAQYGARMDRVPSDEVKARLADVLLAEPATNAIANGTVGVAYVRMLSRDPAYQLK